MADKKPPRVLAAYTMLVSATETVQGLLKHQMESFGLTMSQFHVLESLMRDSPLSQAVLGKKIQRGDSSINVVVTNLERHGWIARRAHRTDRRKVMIHLTPKGRKLIERLYPHHAKVVRAQMCVLSGREQETLRRLCRKLSIGNPGKFIRELMKQRADEAEDG
jgi:MarR family transcriptional regulator, 2-MHQ and catechol-resistance regulon repressor